MPSSYLIFQHSQVESHGKKTDVYYVRSRTSGHVLGRVRWLGAWRQYVFAPDPLTSFNPDCLSEIGNYCAEKTREHREDLAEARAVV